MKRPTCKCIICGMAIRRRMADAALKEPVTWQQLDELHSRLLLGVDPVWFWKTRKVGSPKRDITTMQYNGVLFLCSKNCLDEFLVRTGGKNGQALNGQEITNDTTV